MGEIDEFNTLAFEKKLMQLKDTQDCIQSLSSWCLRQREHHKKIVSSWLNVLKRVKIEQRLVLFYLANDVIQYSKRKNYEFVESWGLNLQKATPLVRDEKVRPKILRIFKIWEQRAVYDDEFLSDLTGLLSAGAIKKTDDDPLDFQPQQLVNKIKQCTVLEADTDLRLKYIHESHLQLSDADALCTSLKDRSLKEDVEKELNEGIACVERYTQALQREIVAREALLALLTTANQYYSTQRGEVKVVAYAYKNFGARVRALKRKLDDLTPTLPNAAPSPPQRDEDVPSPGPDEDLDLPNLGDGNDGDDDISYNIDQTFNTSIAADGSLYNLGLSSFLTADNPLALFNESADVTLNNVASATLSQKSQDTLPGLDLLTPESTGNPPPPTSFYGTMNTIIDENEPYQVDNPPWNNDTWNVPVTPILGVPPPQIPSGRSFLETPESPPHVPPVSLPPPVYPLSTQEIPPSDVDHRGILPPPPPPPSMPMLGNIEDVDHRLLPTLPPPPPPVTTSSIRHTSQQDVDHRNLISLTHMLPTPRQLTPLPMDPRPGHPITMVPPPKLDQVSGHVDYRVPPLITPSDIVESVDMDLSEDEDQPGMFPNQNPSEHQRRHSFNNNKVLVGGDSTNHNDQNHTNLIQINSTPKQFEKKEPPHSAPILPPMANPFDNMPAGLKPFNLPPVPFPSNFSPNFHRDFDNKKEENSNDSAFEEDLRSRGLESIPMDIRNPSPPDFENFVNESEWQNPRMFNNHRFPRNWGPRTNFRPQGPQFWPRNNQPRPSNRWMGPRPQRFW